MAEVLEVLELADQHGVAQVDIGSRGIKSRLDAQRLSGLRGALELGAKLLDPDRLLRALGEVSELLVGRHSRNMSCRTSSSKKRQDPDGGHSSADDRLSQKLEKPFDHLFQFLRAQPSQTFSQPLR